MRPVLTALGSATALLAVLWWTLAGTKALEVLTAVTRF